MKKWHVKLFIALLILAMGIHFFGPEIKNPEHHDEHAHAEHGEHESHDEHDEHDEHHHDHDHDDERTVHYEITEPKNVQEANNILQERTKLISDIIAKEALDNNDLEKIHEHSYSLEAAVDKLRDEKAYKKEDDIDYLDEAVQALHYASENHEEATSREWFGRLKVALANL